VGHEAVRSFETEEEAREDATQLSLEQFWAGYLRQAEEEIKSTEAERRGVPDERLQSGLVSALRLLGVATAALGQRNRAGLRVALGEKQWRTVLLAQQSHHTALAGTLRAALEVNESVAVVREHAFAIPSTYHQVESLRRRLETEKGPCFLTVTRREIAQLMALHDFLSAGRSGDLPAGDVRPLGAEAAAAWVRKTWDVREWKVIARLLAAVTPVEEDETVPLPMAPAPSEPVGAAFMLLRRLRVASIDRLVRELGTVDPKAGISRATVLADLEGKPVRRLGSSIVALDRGVR